MSASEAGNGADSNGNLMWAQLAHNRAENGSSGRSGTVSFCGAPPLAPSDSRPAGETSFNTRKRATNPNGLCSKTISAQMQKNIANDSKKKQANLMTGTTAVVNSTFTVPCLSQYNRPGYRCFIFPERNGNCRYISMPIDE